MCPRFALAHTGTRKRPYVAKYQSKRSKPRTAAEPKVFENTDQPTLEGRNMKDKLNIVKITFTSGVNAATQEFPSHTSIDRCPLCGIALNEHGVCPKCGYKK